MKYLLVLSALVVVPLLAATPAAAQMQGPFNQTATATSFAPSPGSMVGATVMESATWDGSVSGMPLNGAISVQENRSHAIDAGAGSLQAQFTMTDGAGSSIFGSLNGQFSMDVNGSSASGSYTISGGTGAFSGVSGSGSFTESIAMGGAPTLNLSGVLAGPVPQYAPQVQVYQYPQYQYPAQNVYVQADPNVVYLPQSPQVLQQGGYAYTTTPGASVLDTGSGMVVLPYTISPSPNAPSAITGQESRQGCNVYGEGRAYSITGQPC